MKIKKTKNKWLYVAFWAIFSIGLLTAVYAFVWYSLFKYNIPSPFFRRGDWVVVLLYSFLLYVFTTFLKGYKIGISHVIELIYAHCVAIFITNIFTYIQISLLNFGFFNPSPLIIMSIVQVVLIAFWLYVGNMVFFNIYPPKNMLIVTCSEDVNRIEYKMAQQHQKYKIAGHIKMQNMHENEIVQIIRNYDAIVLAEADSALQNILVPLCFENNKNLYFFPTPTNVIISATEQKNIMDTPMLLSKNQGVSGGVLFVKKCIDIVLAFVLLVLTSPLMLLTAILIKVQDGGNVIFKQERLTKNGKKFNLYKFRSMIENAEADGIARLAKENDSRITAVGKFIRRTRFDELPQLINILRGDITFVGPRPERPEIAEQYEKDFPQFRYRLKVKAGLTGYSQVIGRYNTTPRDKLLLDLYYIKNCSILLDFEIILMTAKILILPESTQGVEQVTALQEPPDS